VADADKRISVERVIAAPPARIFDVLADPAQHVAIDGSGTVKAARGGSPARLSLGSKFGMSMRMGVPYRTANTVVEFEENRRIGWWHLAHNLWLYELEPADGGTLVRESFDWSRSRAPWILGPFGFLSRNRAAMEQTLERLDRHVTGGRSGS
jgi:uncharacterized protein YndB with AHSA1/START domain